MSHITKVTRFKSHTREYETQMSLEMKDLCKLFPAFKRNDRQQDIYQHVWDPHISLIYIFLYIYDTLLFWRISHFMDDKFGTEFLTSRQVASAGGKVVHKLLVFSHHVC